MSKGKTIVGFIALSIAMFMGILDSTIINIALPDITDYFHANLSDTSWISTIYVLALSIFTITASKLADQFGRKKVMLVGLFLFGASSALCGFSQSLLFLIIVRFIQGLGGAILMPVAIPMGIALFGKKKMGMVSSAMGAVTALAAAGGPLIGGVLLHYFNWQSVFFVNVPFTVIAFVLIVFFTRESYDTTVSKSVDFAGMLLLTAALFLMTFGLLKGNDYGWHSPTIVLMFLGTAVSLALFLFVEAKVKAPMIEFHLFRELTFTASSAVYMISGFGIVTTSLIFNFFLQNVLNYQPLQAAYIVMTVSLTIIIAMPLGNLISSKFGFRPVNVLGIIIMGVATLLLARLDVDTSKPIMIIEMIIFGLGFGFSCLAMVSAIKYLPEEKSGIGSGIVNAARQVGTCIGIALLVSILDMHVSDAKTEIRDEAIHTIRQLDVASSVKSVAIGDMKRVSAHSGSKNQTHLENQMKKDIKKALTASSYESHPSDNQTLRKLYDGADRMQNGAQSLSKYVKTYAMGVNQTLFFIIRNDRMSTQKLTLYREELAQEVSDYQVATGKKKDQLQKGIANLTGLITLYTVGTDPSVKNAQMFEAKLQQMANQDKKNTTLVSAGHDLEAAGAKLEHGSAQLKKGIALTGQAEAMQKAMKHIESIKNDKIAEAFDKDFMIAGIILLASSFLGLFTDKRVRKKSIKDSTVSTQHR
ncbi:MFS transporter [Sporolactobacillus laevolacticus]|uniref:Permease n=1 Tax=Sporolactobacillus laevolacticus DSM 442 TaxID=1395513 RepID=V6IVR9_9BACL|nr:MFS transporter [Sporolactobacillus laevolacticus]EST11348.1 permease [Sporolactobacillus laevolacticus DSM 442]